MPLIAPCATAPNITVEKGKVKEFVFRSCFIDPFQGRVMAEFADKNLKVKNVAILYDASGLVDLIFVRADLKSRSLARKASLATILPPFSSIVLVNTSAKPLE